MIINPQIILFYDTSKIISRIIFLTFDNNIEGTKVWDLYNLIKSQPVNIITSEPEFIKDHIILTYNLELCKGYVADILNLNENIILFSLFHNIEYYYANNEIFNPFKLDNVRYTNLLKYSDKTFLYELSDDITDGLVLCVTLDSNIKFPNHTLGSPGRFVQNHRNYIIQILNNIFLNDYKLNINVLLENKYTSQIGINDFIKLSNLKNYNKILIFNDNDKFYIKGDNIRLYTDEINDYYKYLNIKNKDNVDIVKIYDDTLILKDYDEFLNFLHANNITNINIKYNKTNVKIEVLFDVLLNPGLSIEYEYSDFFITHTRTKNIFLLYKINIILSKNHIQFTANKLTKDFANYITLLILGYNNIFNAVKTHKNIKKINDIYTSRYCQDSKKIKRKPVLIENFDIKNYNKISDIFYEGKYDVSKSNIRKGTLKIFENYKYGDIFIDKYNLMYMCIDPNYSRIGFLENIFSISGECYACCYSKSKTKNTIYKNCIYNTNEPLHNENEIDGFLLHFGRLILNKSKISFLPDFLNNILNADAEINITNNTNRLINADKYCIVSLYLPTTTIKYFNDIYNFCKNNNVILVNKKSIYITEHLVIDQNTKIFIIIQNKLHCIKEIYKNKKSDKIIMKEVSFNKIKLVYDKFANIKFQFDISHNNIQIKNGICYYKNMKIETKTLNYLIEYKHYHKYNTDLYKSILNIFDSYINKHVETDNVELFKKTFMIKILDHLNITSIVIEQSAIENYIKKYFNIK
jgi:hypothetical protein